MTEWSGFFGKLFLYIGRASKCLYLWADTANKNNSDCNCNYFANICGVCIGAFLRDPAPVLQWAGLGGREVTVTPVLSCHVYLNIETQTIRDWQAHMTGTTPVRQANQLETTSLQEVTSGTETDIASVILLLNPVWIQSEIYFLLPALPLLFLPPLLASPLCSISCFFPSFALCCPHWLSDIHTHSNNE